MADLTVDAIGLARAAEALRQEQVTFDQNQRHENLWFFAKLGMALVAILGLPFIAWVCSTIMLNPTAYDANTITAATAGLLVDVVGLVSATWKVVLNPKSVGKLAPLTLPPILPPAA
jgi:hypothetical protein